MLRTSPNTAFTLRSLAQIRLVVRETACYFLLAFHPILLFIFRPASVAPGTLCDMPRVDCFQKIICVVRKKMNKTGIKVILLFGN